MESQNIQVMVRVRPLNYRETHLGSQLCVNIPASNIIDLESKPDPKRFTFDYVLGPDATQDQVFQLIGKPVTQASLSGLNSCIFAYGQTGAGKTYTMQGKGFDDSAIIDKTDQQGLQPRVVQHLYDQINNQFEEKDYDSIEWNLKCCYLEIYNEQIIDLLSENKLAQLNIREDVKKGVYVENLTELAIDSYQQAISYLQLGINNRHVSSTQMNLESSRSHSIFTIIIESKVAKSGIINMKKSRLNFVDLAGSERQKQTSSYGERLKEASNINKSLTVLGLVINTLVENCQNGQKRYIPYRDSKLTFMLRESLGGNSKTVMIASISPASQTFQETLGTLKFAQRAKQIKNQAVINEETGGSVEVLKQEIQRLKKELSQKVSYKQNQIMNGPEYLQLTSLIQEKDKYLEMLKEDLVQLEEEKNKIEEKNYEMERQVQQMKKDSKQLKEQKLSQKDEFNRGYEKMKGEFNKLLNQAKLSLDEFEQEKQQILREKQELICENHEYEQIKIDLEDQVKNYEQGIKEDKQLFNIYDQEKIDLQHQIHALDRNYSKIQIELEQNQNYLSQINSENEQQKQIIQNLEQNNNLQKQEFYEALEKNEEEKLLLSDTIVQMKEELDTVQQALLFQEAELEERVKQNENQAYVINIQNNKIEEQNNSIQNQIKQIAELSTENQEINCRNSQLENRKIELVKRIRKYSKLQMKSITNQNLLKLRNKQLNAIINEHQEYFSAAFEKLLLASGQDFILNEPQNLANSIDQFVQKQKRIIKELQFNQQRNLQEIQYLTDKNSKNESKIVTLEKEIELCKINNEAMNKFQDLQNELSKQKNKLKNFLESYNLINDKLCLKEKENLKLSAELQLERTKKQKLLNELDDLKSQELQTNQNNKILSEKVSFLNLEKEQYYQGDSQQLKEDAKYQKLCDQIKHLTLSNQKATEELNNTVKKYRKSEEEKYLLQKKMEEKLQSQNELNKIRKEVSMLQSLKDQNEALMNQNQKQSQLLNRIQNHFSKINLNQIFLMKNPIKNTDDVEERLLGYLQMLSDYDKELENKNLDLKGERQNIMIERAQYDLIREENKLLKIQLRRQQEKENRNQDIEESSIQKKIKIVL